MRNTQNFKWDGLSLGTCYYPEHWDESLWREDLQRMKANGIFTIRIAGSRGVRLNPEKGNLPLGFLIHSLMWLRRKG